MIDIKTLVDEIRELCSAPVDDLAKDRLLEQMMGEEPEKTEETEERSEK